MPQARKLPDCDQLAKHLHEDKMSLKEIALRYGTTPEGVRQALERCGIHRGPKRPSHAKYMPWRVRADHVGDVLARRLRSYSKRQQGLPMSDTDKRLLDEWLAYMDGANQWGIPLAVHYDRRDDAGWWLEPRRPEDRDYIHAPDLKSG